MFSCKIILARHEKKSGDKSVYLQAIIDRREVLVPLGFYLEEKYFDEKGFVKSTHANHFNLTSEMQIALARGINIASSFRQQRKRLTTELFKKEFTNPSDEIDVIKYIKRELDLRTPELAPNTVKQHNTVINKLTNFSKVIRFADLCPELMQKFKNHLSKKNSASTVNKLLKIVKQYLDDARKKGNEFEDPFKLIRIKTFRSNRTSLSEKELQRLEEYYAKNDTSKNHKKLLSYFLFSCYTGLRISDIGQITWSNISDDLLRYIPQKTKAKGEVVTVPLTREKKYLPTFKKGNRPIFETYSDQVSNRILKAIAGKVEIKKNVTYHTSRHTFGTMMAEGGHLVETQRMMGHGDIKTTMDYQHTSVKSLIEAKEKRFGDKK
jgi:integrase